MTPILIVIYCQYKYHNNNNNNIITYTRAKRSHTDGKFTDLGKTPFVRRVLCFYL